MRHSPLLFIILVISIVGLAGCEVAGDIFKAGVWVHLEAWMKYHQTLGAIKFWQDGKLVIQQDKLTTKLLPGDLHSVWGIGSYTSGIEGHPDGVGIAEVYFDDAAISSVRRGPV